MYGCNAADAKSLFKLRGLLLLCMLVAVQRLIAWLTIAALFDSIAYVMVSVKQGFVAYSTL